MIPQTLTSPTPGRNDLSDGSDKIFGKCNSSSNNDANAQEKDCRSDSRTTVSLKNLRNDIEESIVQWKQKNIKDGFVIVDEAQLSRLIKREPIEKYYKLEQEPFATGVFASLRRCQSLETGVSYAAKFSTRERYGEDCSTEIYHEIALLSLCGSAPRVIQIHDVFENPQEIIIVMEYAPGGDLQTIIDEDLVPFESDVMSFIKQTVEGLEYLHRRRIAHLDIKPQNIVMMGDYPNCEIKLCDFEISRVILEGTTIRELLGTPDYVAPEILHYDPITLAADMWSLGVTTYVLLTGFSPFGGETDQETFCNISKAEVDFPDDLFKDVSNEAIDFIKSLLVKNPRARLTAADCLKHPWLNSSANQPEVIQPPPPEVPVEKEEPYKMRNGCETCQAQKQQELESGNGKSLRKYLSKSREALFEQAIRKYNNNNNNYNNLRGKSTYKNHRFRKTRLCESQISLLSKSRERLLGGEILNAPSRSIEKLYGLRSLSKSQEVLNLYKNGGILASQENLNIVSELIKSRENLLSKNDEEGTKEKKLMRATTADLGILHQRHQPSRMNSYSSTVSLASLSNNMPEDEVDDESSIASPQTNPEEPPQITPQITPETLPQTLKQTLPQTTTQDNHTNVEDKTNLIKEIEKLEERRKPGRNLETDEEEPRFTVAQLIMAYNKHQELVTKTSLEVTMSAPKKEVKIPPIFPYNSKSPFPTGPTALRLFIPDIDLVEMPKCVPKYKTRVPEEEKIDKDSLTERKLPPIVVDPIVNTSERTTKTEPGKEQHKGKHEEEKSQNQRRSKSSSPCIDIQKTEPIRRLGPSGSLDQKLDEAVRRKSPTPVRKPSSLGRSVNRSPSATRKPMTVERSPAVQRRSSSRREEAAKRSESSQYKIVKIGDKNSNSSRKCSGVSYKIEFDSPVVTRKFPVRNSPTKGTISSNLKVKESPNRTKK